MSDEADAKTGKRENGKTREKPSRPPLRASLAFHVFLLLLAHSSPLIALSKSKSDLRKGER